jgi:hypothetical protein
VTTGGARGGGRRRARRARASRGPGAPVATARLAPRTPASTAWRRLRSWLVSMPSGTTLAVALLNAKRVRDLNGGQESHGPLICLSISGTLTPKGKEVETQWGLDMRVPVAVRQRKREARVMHLPLLSAALTCSLAQSGIAAACPAPTHRAAWRAAAWPRASRAASARTAPTPRRSPAA